jgi:hypothetical protein
MAESRSKQRVWFRQSFPILNVLPKTLSLIYVKRVVDSNVFTDAESR